MSQAMVEDILNFWFGPLDAAGLASKEKSKQWFTKDPAFDAQIRSRYGSMLELAPMGAYDLWAKTPEGRVALIVLLDQFPRNVFRNQPRAFYTDLKALVQSRQVAETGEYKTLKPAYAYFTLMPFMHAEFEEMQDLGVKLWNELAESKAGAVHEFFKGGRDYAKLHRDIIAKFGRFPHRNEILHRESTREEIEFLKSGGPTF